MSANSKIEWTKHTFNPWWGCTKVSPACDHCYAERDAIRYGFSETGSQFPIWGNFAQRRFFGDKHWNEPLKWDRIAAQAGERHRVFTASYADVMEDRNDLQRHRERLYELIERTPNLDWLLLTKRPQNFRRFLLKAWLENPRSNVWGMTTVEANAYRWRIDDLMNTPFVVRGLSCEPLMEELRITQMLLTGLIHWVISGGESGTSARPSHPDWHRSLCNQAQEAGVRFLFKQWGEWRPRIGLIDSNKQPMIRLTDAGENGQILGAAGSNDVWMQKVGKMKAGRLLDGREWNEFPEIAA